jgi:arylsulfatase A-like enzyme|tara:strand:- start:4664 stop:6172 length:1509 start_codon:yes stop_codon:yes gene_type:complete
VACLLLAVLACGPADPPAPESEPPPNVVFIMSDTHRWGAMSMTQTPAVSTPNLERLAQQGVSLSRYYVNHPLCTPYRAMLMTGRWPYQQGLIGNHMRLDERVDLPDGERTRGTVSWAFKDAGYTTAHVGKWHLGGNDARAFGFDRSIVWNGTNDHRRSDYSVDGAPTKEWTGLSNATAMTTQALEWIESVRGEPFFLILSLNPAHGPFDDAPEEYKALYPDEAALPLHPLDELRSWETHRDYHALVSNLDAEVGRVLDALDAFGIADETVVVYTSDHGAMSGVNGVAYGQKRHPNDESTRVPFIVRGPGVPAGLELDMLASSIDLFPTLAGLADISGRPQDVGTDAAAASLGYLESLPGADLSSLLRGAPGVAAPTSIFLMHPTNMNNRFSRHEPIWRAVVTDDYTYAVTAEGEYALWDRAESYQVTNLLSDPEHAPRRMPLWNELDTWMDRAERPFIDHWFAEAPSREVAAWNVEYGFGEHGDDRHVGRDAVFDLAASEPR